MKSIDASMKQTQQREAYTVREFCIAYRMSERFFYKLQQQGKGPRCKRIGKRLIITMDDAKKWAESD